MKCYEHVDMRMTKHGYACIHAHDIDISDMYTFVMHSTRSAHTLCHTCIHTSPTHIIQRLRIVLLTRQRILTQHRCVDEHDTDRAEEDE